MNIGHPHRFRTLVDALKFLESPDISLPVPVFIREGDRVRVNPEYQDAPYEQQIIWADAEKGYNVVVSRDDILSPATT